MSDIATVRAIIQDIPQLAFSTVTMVDDQLAFQVEVYPIDPASVIITGDSLPSYTVDADSGQVTFASAFTAQELAVQYKWSLLTDDAISAFLTMNADSLDPVRLAAADALDALATNEILIQKKIKILDLQTDGPSMATALRIHAKALRDFIFGKEQESMFDTASARNCVPERAPFPCFRWDRWDWI